MRKRVLYLVALGTVVVCALLRRDVLGWGQHRYHADLVREVLAPSLKSPEGKERFSKREWDEFVELYSYYPDWGGGGASSPKRTDDLWEYYLNAQLQYRMEGTHSLRATLIYFKLLLETLAAGESRKGALWAGCLTHVIGDAAAANHPPLLMYLTYAHGPLGLTVAPSGASITRELKWIDVAGPSQDAQGKKLLREALADYKPALLAEDAEQAAIRLQLLLHDDWLAALKEEAKIARGFEGWVGGRDEQARELLLRGMTACIMRCTRDAADAIYTAHILAQKKQTFDVDKVLAKGQQRIAEHRQLLRLAQASLYDGLLRETSAQPATGVFLGVPPIYWVSPGCVDLQFCYVMTVITRTLAEQTVPYVTFDIKSPPAVLDPKKVPVVILPPYRKADGLLPERLDKILKVYGDAGGKVLFVGGHPGAALEPLARHLRQSSEGDYFYPLKTKDMPGTNLVLVNSTSRPVGEAMPVHQVLKDFDVRTYGAQVLKPEASANVKPVVYLEAGKKRVVVSAGLVKDGSFRIVYAPWYFFMPGLLSEAREVRKLDQPTLDPRARKVLDHLLSLLKE